MVSDRGSARPGSNVVYRGIEQTGCWCSSDLSWCSYNRNVYRIGVVVGVTDVASDEYASNTLLEDRPAWHYSSCNVCSGRLDYRVVRQEYDLGTVQGIGALDENGYA